MKLQTTKNMIKFITERVGNYAPATMESLNEALKDEPRPLSVISKEVFDGDYGEYRAFIKRQFEDDNNANIIIEWFTRERASFSQGSLTEKNEGHTPTKEEFQLKAPKHTTSRKPYWFRMIEKNELP